MQAGGVPTNESFRYIPGFFPLAVAVGIFFLYGFYLVVNVGRTHGWLFEAKGVLALVLGIASVIFVWSLVVSLWRTNWKFTITSTHFIAVHWYRRRRVEVPWRSITRVSKLPRSWWNGRGGIAFSQIDTAEGHRIQFRTDMLRYRRFLEQLEARAVNCATFEAYRDEWDR